jgi:hypothetical protein
MAGKKPSGAVAQTIQKVRFESVRNHEANAKSQRVTRSLCRVPMMKRSELSAHVVTFPEEGTTQGAACRAFCGWGDEDSDFTI